MVQVDPNPQVDPFGHFDRLDKNGQNFTIKLTEQKTNNLAKTI